MKSESQVLNEKWKESLEWKVKVWNEKWKCDGTRLLQLSIQVPRQNMSASNLFLSDPTSHSKYLGCSDKDEKSPSLQLSQKS